MYKFYCLILYSGNGIQQRWCCTERSDEKAIRSASERKRVSQAFQKALDTWAHNIQYTLEGGKREAKWYFVCSILLHSIEENGVVCVKGKGKNEIYLSLGQCTHAPRLTQTSNLSK